MALVTQQHQLEEEFNTPDRREVESSRGKIERELGELDGQSKEYQGPKELQTPKVLPGSQECLGSQALPGPKIQGGSGGGQQHQGVSSGPPGPSTSASDQTIQVLMKMMEGMTHLQGQIMDNKDKEKDVETVRSQIEFPPLPSWSSTGPVDLSDWLALIEPIMSDLTATSGGVPHRRVSSLVLQAHPVAAFGKGCS